MLDGSGKIPPMKGSSARRSKTPDTGLRRLIHKVERDLNARIDHLRDELRASETALAASRLRELNERLTSEGVAQLRRNLAAQLDAGIIDRKGQRIRPDFPARMTDPASDVV